MSSLSNRIEIPVEDEDLEKLAQKIADDDSE
jgi:hypothetical protein